MHINLAVGCEKNVNKAVEGVLGTSKFTRSLSRAATAGLNFSTSLMWMSGRDLLDRISLSVS